MRMGQPMFPDRVQRRATNVRRSIVLFIAIFMWGCTVSPNYKRPKINVPETYRGAPLQGAAQNPSQPGWQSFGDQKWWDVFKDPQLQQLVRTALTQNYDV